MHPIVSFEYFLNMYKSGKSFKSLYSLECLIKKQNMAEGAEKEK
jgi:hypothetical protein